jgi:DNA polymerase elongation subunit (family B)
MEKIEKSTEELQGNPEVTTENGTFSKNHITEERIIQFLEGHNPEKGVIAVEYDYGLQQISKIVQNSDGSKIIRKDKLKAFAWIKDLKNENFYPNKEFLKTNIKKYGITFKKLQTDNIERLEQGYKFIVHSSKGLNELNNFFRDGGLDPFKKLKPGEKQKEGVKSFRDLVLVLPPIEQYLISTGIRLFKGFDDYNDIHKVVFDIETHGLDPNSSRIFLIGVKDNRGFEELIEMGDDDISEISGIFRFFQIITELKPSLLAGYNSDNFDWYFIFERAKILGVDIKSMCKKMHPNFEITRKQSMLKLANEVEQYEQTLIWGFNVTDIIHSVRRAMAINSDIKSAGLKYIAKENKVAKPNRTHIEGGQIGGLWNDEKYVYNQKTGKYEKYNEFTELNDDDEIVDGKYIVKRYLMDDLQETLDVDNIFGQSSFFISKTIATSFARVSTMGTATLWKMMMMAWSYENDLAIPVNEEKRDFVGGLSRLIRVGYSKRLVKLDFSSLYPSIQITHNIFPETDITGAMKAMLKYFHKARNEFKALGKKYEKGGNAELAKLYDTKQLPIKILNNSFFGSLSAPQVFPWGSMNKAEQITCSARQFLRLMVKFFMSKDFQPIVMDTDGVDFALPDSIDDLIYVGKGLSEKTKKGVEYKGVDAAIAEFNDKYMRGVMGLSLDGEYQSSINLARKNYCDLKLNGKMKLVGNTIKSKKMPGYIEEFIDIGLMMLLKGNGSEFVEYYYEHLSKIFNNEIPALKIAAKNKVKISSEAYITRGGMTNKNGKALPKMVHMELVVSNNVKVNLGDVIYTINNGTKKSHGDIGNSSLVDLKSLENNPNHVEPYNTARYVSIFNKRIEPLMIVFHPDVRDRILKDNPSKREYFTKNELELTNGHPFDPEDQDSIDELFTPSKGEIDFWSNNFNYNPSMFIKSNNEFKNGLPTNWDESYQNSYGDNFNVLEEFWIPDYEN